MNFNLKLQERLKESLLKILKGHRNLQESALKMSGDNLNNFESDLKPLRDPFESFEDVLEREVKFKKFNRDFNKNQLEVEWA